MSLSQEKQDKSIFDDRRAESPEHSIWWEQLSLAQKFSAGSLGKFGYELKFIRHEEGYSLAVMYCNGCLTVINEDGSINTNPNIQIR